MGVPSRVISDCPHCGNPEALTVFAAPTYGDIENFAPEGDSTLIWVSPGFGKATMGAVASCGACGTDFQFRMIMVEQLKLPMKFIEIGDEADGK